MGAATKMLVGITQRVLAMPSQNERHDALDQAWLPFLASCNLEPVLIPNRHPDPVAFVRRLGVRGLILSGGGNVSTSLGTLDGRAVRASPSTDDIAPERDLTETLLLRASLAEGWSVIGVCRGMQVLNLFHGGAIVRVQGHAGVEHPLKSSPPPDASDGYAFDTVVNSFHDFGIAADGLGRGLTGCADADGMPEVIVHESFPHLGLMWHPERNQPCSCNDVQLFRRFFYRTSESYATTRPS